MAVPESLPNEVEIPNLNLKKRSVQGVPLTAENHDNNMIAIEELTTDVKRLSNELRLLHQALRTNLAFDGTPRADSEAFTLGRLFDEATDDGDKSRIVYMAGDDGRGNALAPPGDENMVLTADKDTGDPSWVTPPAAGLVFRNVNDVLAAGSNLGEDLTDNIPLSSLLQDSAKAKIAFVNIFGHGGPATIFYLQMKLHSAGSGWVNVGEINAVGGSDSNSSSVIVPVDVSEEKSIEFRFKKELGTLSAYRVALLGYLAF